MTHPTLGKASATAFTIPAIRLGENLKFLESAIEIIFGRPIFFRPDSSTARYVLLRAVCDYVRLAEADPAKQLLATLDNSFREDIRQKKALLVLDLSNEGPQFDLQLFQALRRQLDEANLPHSHVVFVSQNRQLGTDYNQSFGSQGIRFWTIDYFPIMIANLFAEGRENLSLGDYSPIDGTRDKLFNCFNSAPRWHRVILFRWFQEHNYLPQSLVSFHGTGEQNPKGGEIALDHPPAQVAEAFPNLMHSLRSFLPSEPLRIDDSVAFGNALSTSIPIEAYSRTNLSIVTESDFFDAKTERLTEKSIKAAAMGLPFIIVGPKKSVSLLRDLGFRTFDRLIDHSYDDLDDIDRMRAIMCAIEQCVDWMSRDLGDWKQNAMEDAIFNHHHARRGLVERFHNLVVAPVADQMLNFIQEA